MGERERLKSQSQGSWVIFGFAWAFLKGGLKGVTSINLHGDTCMLTERDSPSE